MAVFAQRLEQHQLTLNQYFILRELWRDDGLTQREISERVRMMGPSITVVLDAMEERGFVVRVRSTEDRRRINVFLTEKGRELGPVILRYSAQQHDIILAGRSEADVAFVRDFLQSIRVKADALRTSELTA
jgi:DNA-binding MarR family transcriptional regulator